MFTRIRRARCLTAVADAVGQNLARRNGSPSSCPDARRDVHQKLESPSRAFCGQRRDGADDVIELEAGVFDVEPAGLDLEKSRMSLMMLSSDVPALWTLLT